MVILQGYINSITDYERAYGAFGKLAFGSQGIRKFGQLRKTFDAPMLTSTSGAFQYIVGPQLWAQLNTEANVFAAVAKKEWSESGIRVITAFPTTKIRGVAQSTSSVGASVLPSFVQYQPTIKVMETPFDASLQAIYLGARGEMVTWEQFREFMGVVHKVGINETLLTTVDTPASNNFESLDRLVSGYSESTLVSAGTDVDVFGLDRHTAASWADATVLHNSGTNRPLSRNLLNTLQRTVFNATGDTNPGNYFWLTGLDTYQRWNELVDSLQRLNEQNYSFSPLNGVTLGFEGQKEVSMMLAVYARSPIIMSHNVLADGISRVYYVHKDHTHFRVVQPTVYREVGISTGQEILLGRYGDAGLFYSAGELISNFFAASGKLINLS